jgi:hypothetical protein
MTESSNRSQTDDDPIMSLRSEDMNLPENFYRNIPMTSTRFRRGTVVIFSRVSMTAAGRFE